MIETSIERDEGINDVCPVSPKVDVNSYADNINDGIIGANEVDMNDQDAEEENEEKE